jgi:hypothetical protein
MIFSISCTLGAASCTASSPVSPSAVPAGVAEGGSRLEETSGERPVSGSCATTFAPVAAPPPETCSAFEAAPSAFVSIAGECRLTHLGRSSVLATQQLLFLLDNAGRPVIVDGAPIVNGLRNCGVFTAADGDQLRHTTTGTVAPGTEPGTVTFDGTITITGGTGRFGGASGQASFDGSASLVTNTGNFSTSGRVRY